MGMGPRHLVEVQSEQGSKRDTAMKPKDRELTFEEKVEELYRKIKPLPKPRLTLELSYRLAEIIEEGATVKIVVRERNGVSHMLRPINTKIDRRGSEGC